MFLTIFLLFLGLVLLLGGADFLVRGAAALAERIGVSPFMIGLLLIGFGTSAPEMVASLESALHGYPGLAVGNVVGSNITNILLVLGVAGLICPLCCERLALRRDGMMLLIASTMMVMAIYFDMLNRPVGIGFLIVLVAYLVFTFREDKKDQDATAELHAREAAFVLMGPRFGLALEIVQCAGGGIALVGGASLLVDSAVTIASETGVSDAVVGLTLVALGTSLPELAASVIAALKQKADIAVGNVVGSNIFNALSICGVVSTVTDVPVPPEIASFHIWVMAVASVALIYFAFTGARISRTEGAMLFGGYCSYLFVIAF